MILRPASLADCVGLAPRLRPEDRTEVELTGGRPEEVLRDAWLRGAFTQAICTDGGAVAGVWGVVPIVKWPHVGSIWMLGAPEIASISKSFIRACEPAVAHAHTLYPTLTCFAWAGNPVHQKWLRWLGFKASGSYVPGFTYYERHHV